jgi:hypothetical protein
LLLLISVSIAYGGSLRGVVRDGQSLVPLPSVKVTVHVLNPDSIAFPTTTDQNGAYSITGIIPNNKIYVIVVNQEGYIYSYTRLDSLGSLDLVYDISLVPNTTIPHGSGSDSSTVSGTILAQPIQNGSLKPIANTQVGLSSGAQQFNTTTNSQGKYTINIPIGYYVVTMSADGYKNLKTTGLRVDTNGASINAILQSISTSVEIISDQEQSRPEGFALLDAYPNPFNPSTTIQFSLPERGWATLRIYDNLGREVTMLANGEFEGGVEHAVTFHASKLTSGVYFSRLEFKSQQIVRKLVLMK